MRFRVSGARGAEMSVPGVRFKVAAATDAMHRRNLGDIGDCEMSKGKPSNSSKPKASLSIKISQELLMRPLNRNLFQTSLATSSLAGAVSHQPKSPKRNAQLHNLNEKFKAAPHYQQVHGKPNYCRYDVNLKPGTQKPRPESGCHARALGRAAESPHLL